MVRAVSLYAAAVILKLSILYANTGRTARVACFLIKPADARLIEKNYGLIDNIVEYLKTCVILTVSK